MCLLLGQENSPEMIWWSFFAIVDGDKLHLTGSRGPRWITSSSCRKDGNPRISKSVLWESTIRISSSTRPSQHPERPPRRSRTSELGQLGRFAMSATLSSAMLSIANAVEVALDLNGQTSLSSHASIWRSKRFAARTILVRWYSQD